HCPPHPATSAGNPKKIVKN
ncbi:hypothetical protein A2U01_0066032, partial [Trifolium medium]|nr:hypothetical protein [Trifolium medium]